MLVHIKGSSSFQAKVAIDKIKEKYLSAHQNDTQLVELDEESQFNWADLSAVPLFGGTRLVVIKRAGLFDKKSQDDLAYFLKDLSSSTVVVLWDEKAIDPTSDLGKILSSSPKIIPAEPLDDSQLARWIKNRADGLEVKISNDEVREIADCYGDDLWSIENHLKSQVGGSAELHTKRPTPDEPFIFFRLLRANNLKAVSQELIKKNEQGEAIEMTIGSLASAVRKEVKDPQLLKDLTELLADVDLGLKVGILDEISAITILSNRICTTASQRVQWDSVWLDQH